MNSFTRAVCFVLGHNGADWRDMRPTDSGRRVCRGCGQVFEGVTYRRVREVTVPHPVDEYGNRVARPSPALRLIAFYGAIVGLVGLMVLAMRLFGVLQ